MRFLISLLMLLWMLPGLAAPLPPGNAADPDAPALNWPEVRRETKPWTRWWWFGNIADEQSLTAQLQECAAAGLGGLELTPIYGVRGYEDRFVPYLSPRWLELLAHTLTEARRFDLGIDLATGTGWPFGGPWLEERDAAHSLRHRTYRVPPGERLQEPISFTERGVIRVAGPRPVSLDELRQPVSANPNLQDLALDQVRFERPWHLVTLMGFPALPNAAAAGQPLSPAPLDLTARVQPDGTLDWVAPARSGAWTLHAVFAGPHGKMVERAAPGGEGYALDHFSSAALSRYLARFDAAFREHHLLGDLSPGVRAFFNDSYEVDDAEGEADWTPRFFAEFQQRRGYDLRTRLPDLFAAAESDISSRVRSDYRETISDLLLDEFTRPWQAWARSRGAQIRNQAHNAPANILDLYAASDIPEQEGNGFLAMKLASSAAHVAGKPLASAETATWLNEHFLTTLAELKRNADEFLLAGLNHLCYHGTAFSPPDAPWPGFNFYASVELNPANPLWHDFRALNAYVTRVQSFLQTGAPDEDVLLYYNIHDRWAERGDGRLPHFGHGGRDPVGVGAGRVAAALHDAGVGFDYVSDRLLESVAVSDGDGGADLPFANRAAGSNGATLRAGQALYRAIVVPPTSVMPESTLVRLIELASRGATILVLQHLPRSPPGLRGGEDRHRFEQLLQRLNDHAVVADGITTIPVDRGQFVVGPSLESLLGRSPEIPRESLKQFGLEHLRRRTDTGRIYLIANRSPNAVARWIPLQAPAVAAALYDPMTGAAGIAALRSAAKTSTAATEVYLQLAPGASCVIQLHASAIAAPGWRYWRPAGAAYALTGRWSVTFTQGGPALPEPANLSSAPTADDSRGPARERRDVQPQSARAIPPLPQTTLAADGRLPSWTEFAGEPGRAFSGTAVYSIEFEPPSGAAEAWQLDLGTICDSARITLNGCELATLILPPWRVIIPRDALLERNTLEVAVTNLAANRIADLDRRRVPWKIFYNANFPARLRESAGPDRLFTAAHWSPRNSGLLGPVKLTPLHAFDPK